MRGQIVVYMYNGILLSHKKEEILMSAVTEMNLESTMLSERARHEKDPYCMIPLCEISG